MTDDFDAWYPTARSSLDPALAAWCGDPGIASDALDEAFVRALERWDRVRSLEAPRAWVWRTAVNVVRRRMRRTRIEESLMRRRTNGRPTSIPGPSGDDLDLRRALLTLTERQRAAVTLFYIADLPTAEVAEVLGVAPGTVSATLHQARALLRSRLESGPIETHDAASASTPDVDGALP